MAELIFKFNKKFSRMVCGILLTALLFSLSVTLEASARHGVQSSAGQSYKLTTAVVLASAESDTPTEPIELPDYLVPRSGGFCLPSEEEFAQYQQISDTTGDTDGGTPADSQAEEVVSTTVPASKAVGDDYFADTVFIGDSRIVGLMNYSGVKSYYYAKVSLNIFSVLHTKFLTPSDGSSDDQLTVLEALKQYPVFKKVYICFGINELGYNPSVFINAYEYFLDQVMELLPDATVYIQAVFPVTAEVSARNRYGVNNDAVVNTNALLYGLAEKKGVHYVNVYEQFAGENGALDPDLTADGIHLNKAGIKLQMEYLRTHTAGAKTASAAQTVSNITD